MGWEDLAVQVGRVEDREGDRRVRLRRGLNHRRVVLGHLPEVSGVQGTAQWMRPDFYAVFSLRMRTG